MSASAPCSPRKSVMIRDMDIEKKGEGKSEPSLGLTADPASGQSPNEPTKQPRIVCDVSLTDATLERVDRSFQKLLTDLKRTFEELQQTSFTLMEENDQLKRGMGGMGGWLDVPESGMGISDQHEAHDDDSQGNEDRSDNFDSSSFSSQDEQEQVDSSDQIFPEWPIEQRLESKLMKSKTRFSKQEPDFFKFLPDMDADECIVSPDPCVFSPVSRFRLSWDCASCLVLSLQLWIVPFSTVFLEATRSRESETPWPFLFLEDFTTFFFMVDLVLNFNTGIIRSTDESSVIIMDRRTIVREYVTGFFWIDLLSTIPFDRLIEHVDSNVFAMVRILRVARWLKLLRFIRMLNAVRIVRSLSKSFELEMQRLKKRILVPLLTVIAVALLSHVQGCIWAFLQPEDLECLNMFSCYHESFMHALLALLLGTRIGSSQAGGAFWVLDLVVAVERLVLICISGLWLIYHALYHLKSYSKSERLTEDVLAYMELRHVSHKTQVHVLGQLNNVSKIANVRRSYDAWIASGIPHELQRSICEELWLHRLITMQLINYVVRLNPAIKTPLVMLVREETLAKHNILFKEGDSPVGAYMILNGVLYVESSLVEEEIPPFTTDMWIGEKALVNPALPRTLTAICNTTCSLMAVPARGFQELLIEHAVLPQFETYVVENLWHGICGRCGSVGDHFADKCPMFIFNGADIPKLASAKWKNSKECDREDTGLSSLAENTLQSWIGGAGGSGASDSDGDSMPYVALRKDTAREKPVKRDLKEYLYSMKLTQMLPVLNAHGIYAIAEMENLTEDDKARILAGMQERQADEGLQLHVMALQQALELENIMEFQDALEDRSKEFLGTMQKRAQHIVFLSHHKLDGGTEASLLRHELETQIQLHPVLKRKLVESPVFLDSEDLANLEALQEHIANSQNILLLLTNDVLTRPWVLIELATAMKLGINILPVEVRKPGNQFAYPDEKFYEALAAGQLLPSSSMRILQTYGVSLMQVESALRKVFNCISFPYSPHRPFVFRKAEVEDILKNCVNKQDDGRSNRKPPKKLRRRRTKRLTSTSGLSGFAMFGKERRRSTIISHRNSVMSSREERAQLLEAGEDELSEQSSRCQQQ